jgi:hypothetical protein
MKLQYRQRWNVKEVLIALAFLVILVSPAFTALNVFTGKNRF